MTRGWHPVVAVPARNEALRIPRLVEALGRQTWCAVTGSRLPVIIVFNNCDDGSAAIAARAAERFPRLRLESVEVDFLPDRAHVGTARSLAMERAYAASPVEDRSVLLTTDADGMPAPDWVEANVRAIAAGADLVGGRVAGDPLEEAPLGAGFLRRARMQGCHDDLADRLASLIDPLSYDPWPRHRFHLGASLAVRAEVYRAVGGMEPRAFREDIGFVSRVRAAGYSLRHAPDVRVCVSARLIGRARFGMADCLLDWRRAVTEGRPHLVASPALLDARLRSRRVLRDLEGGSPQDYREAAARLGLPTENFFSDGRQIAVPALIELITPDDPEAPETVPVESAITELRDRIADAEADARAA